MPAPITVLSRPPSPGELHGLRAETSDPGTSQKFATGKALGEERWRLEGRLMSEGYFIRRLPKCRSYIVLDKRTEKCSSRLYLMIGMGEEDRYDI